MDKTNVHLINAILNIDFCGAKTTIRQLVWLEKEFPPLGLKKSTQVLFPCQRCPSYSLIIYASDE